MAKLLDMVNLAEQLGACSAELLDIVNLAEQLGASSGKTVRHG